MTATPPVQPRASLQQIRQAELIAATKVCLASRGLSDTTIRVIAAQAQTTPSSVLYHFKSKEDLILAAVADAADELRGEVEREIADEPTAVGKLKRLVGLSLTSSAAGNIRWRLWLEVRSQAARDSFVRNTYVAKYDVWLASLNHILQEGIASGEFTSSVDAAMVSAVIDGVAFYLLIHPDTNPKVAGDWCVQTLLASLTRPCAVELPSLGAMSPGRRPRRARKSDERK